MALSQDLAGLAHLLEPFHFLDPNIEQAHARALDPEQHRGHGAAHSRHVDEMSSVGADRGPEIEHDRFAFQSRPDRGDRGPFDLGHGLELELGHGHERPGIAGGYRYVGLPLLDRIDGEPHRRLPAPFAERLAWLVVHLDCHVGVDHARGLLQPRPLAEQRIDHRAVAEQQELDIGMAGERQLGTGNDYLCPMVSPHGVEGDADFLGHGAGHYSVGAGHNRGAENQPSPGPFFALSFFTGGFFLAPALSAAGLSVESAANGRAESFGGAGCSNTAPTLRG